MSTQTARYAAGVRLPERCRFCGGAENLDAESGWTRVDAHSHDGEHVTTIVCHDCDGAFVSRERGNKRATTMDDMTLVGQHWDIPEGYAVSVCSGCGETAGVHALDDDEERALVAAIERDEITTTCCDARGRIETDRAVVEADR